NAFESANFSITPIPEPETYALMMAGLGVMGFVARRRRKG
ncbi:MAG: FxDxF family PEP-CTERM protein, partial [Caldimonas sp.]